MQRPSGAGACPALDAGRLVRLVLADAIPRERDEAFAPLHEKSGKGTIKNQAISTSKTAETSSTSIH